MNTSDVYIRTETSHKGGLRCIECDKKIEVGGEYTRKFVGMYLDSPSWQVICLWCKDTK